jgi:hypothetical protein
MGKDVRHRKNGEKLFFPDVEVPLAVKRFSESKFVWYCTLSIDILTLMTFVHDGMDLAVNLVSMGIR